MLIVIIVFGCYLRKTHRGSYDFDVDKTLNRLERGSIRASKIMFHPHSLDAKVWGSQSSSPFSNVKAANLDGNAAKLSDGNVQHLNGDVNKTAPNGNGNGNDNIYAQLE